MIIKNNAGFSKGFGFGFGFNGLCSVGVGAPGVTSHDDVPVVLDSVVCAPWEKPCDDCPSVAVNPV